MEAIAIVQILNPITLAPSEFKIFTDKEYDNPYEEALSYKSDLLKCDWAKNLIVTLGSNHKARILKVNSSRAMFGSEPKNASEID